MARYQIILAYDGTDYQGFQRQENAQTIQGSFEKALRKLSWDDRSVLAAGRTDAGVHAYGQVVAFDLDWAHSDFKLRNALNANLPRDIAVREVKKVPSDFHPRFEAVRRKYIYTVINQDIRDPLRERYAWRVWPAPNFELLQEASQHLIGDHDFAAFGTPPQQGGSTLRTIMDASWKKHHDDIFTFEIISRAFLYQMVRRIVAIQILIGQRELDIQELEKYLSKKTGIYDRDQQLFNKLAPPHGLVLSEVSYSDEDTSKSFNLSKQKRN